MNDFMYHIPTKVYFGKDQLHHPGEELKQYCTRVLMTYGDSLYKRWFNSYPHHDKLTIQAEELNFEGYIVYIGMILRNDNPYYNELLDTYKAFVERANTIYNIQPK